MDKTEPLKHWYVVLTKPRSEEVATCHLAGKGIEVFYPKLFIPTQSARSRQIMPLFPNYLFVRFDAEFNNYSQVIWCRGVKRLVRFGDRPLPVEDRIIEFLREQARQHGVIVAKSKLKAGDEVHISKGAFKGLVGIIQEPPDGKTRVKLLMSMLSRDVQVELPTRYINMGWVAPAASM